MCRTVGENLTAVETLDPRNIETRGVASRLLVFYLGHMYSIDPRNIETKGVAFRLLPRSYVQYRPQEYRDQEGGN